MPDVRTGSSLSDDLRDEVSSVPEDTDVQGSAPADSREQLRQELRKCARESLYFLCKSVLGYKDMTPHTHGEFCRVVQDDSIRNLLSLMPRSVFKTSIATIGYSIFLLINDPNLFILIANQVAGNAERMLEEIESHMDGTNPIFAWLFPEYIKPFKNYAPWSTQEMTVPCRSISSGTPSIMARGVGAKLESNHFHYIICDDLVGEKALESPSIMENAIIWHDYATSLLVDPSKDRIRVTGTRWSLSDLYSIIMEYEDVTVFKRQAIDPKTGELLFPERLTADVLRKIRERNFMQFMANYQNEPRSTESLDFKLDWLNYFLLKPDDKLGPYCEMGGVKYFVKDMHVVLAVDPAGSGDVDARVSEMLKRGRAKRSDNAIVVWGLHGSGYFFLLDIWKGRTKGGNPEYELGKKMLEFFQKWRGYVSRGYMESYGAQRALIAVFEMICKQQGEAFRLDPIGREIVKAKKVRIRSYLGGHAQNRLICVRRIQDAFINEYGDFPQSDEFDALDASVWAFQGLRKPDAPVEQHQSELVNLKARRRLRQLSPAGY